MIFIDTSGLLAALVEQDQYHKEAYKFWNEIVLSKEDCTTSILVLNETINLLSRRCSYEFAYQIAEKLFASKLLNILRTNIEDEKNALELLKKYSDQKISYTDCVSFVLMKKNKIKRAFTFDQHFNYVGLTKLPN